MPPASPSDPPYVILFDDDACARVRLPTIGETVLGTCEDATVRWKARGSEQHRATLRTHAGGATLQVKEGQQTTRLNGTAVGPEEPLASGDEVTFGAVTIAFHSGPEDLKPRTALDATLLRQRLAEEAERFLRYESPFAVLVMELGEGQDRQQAAAAACRALRKVDVVGWTGRWELAAILPETIEAAEIPARRVIASLGGEAVRVGISLCPVDACQPEALLAGARAAARAARPGTVQRLRDTITTVQVGGVKAQTADPAMVRLLELVRRVAASDMPVLIHGETGAGKEVIAQALHAWSPRSGRELVAVNCAAIPETLLESELFGFERGAFSGATQSKAGLLEKASGGTLLLDEVGDLSPGAQAKLLRALETHRVMRLGGTLERVVDVRVVSATHRNLEEQSTAPRFRSDLYYRLSATTLLVPPLRDRPLDICLLARAFLQHACDDLGKPPIALSSAALRRLTLHNWPGNVRELKNVMRYLAAAVSGTEALACQLPDRVAATAAPWMVAEGSAAARRQTAEDRPACEGVFRNIHEEIEELERTRIRQALEHTGGVRVKAAQLIGMPLRTMLTKMKQYGLEAIAVSEGKPRS